MVASAQTSFGPSLFYKTKKFAEKKGNKISNIYFYF